MEIACTRSSQDLFKARQAYHARYKRSIEEDVAYHTAGDFRKVLQEAVHLLQLFDHMNLIQQPFPVGETTSF